MLFTNANNETLGGIHVYVCMNKSIINCFNERVQLHLLNVILKTNDPVTSPKLIFELYKY